MFINMCNLYVQPRLNMRTHVSSVIFRIMFMAYLNTVTLFALWRGLVHGFRGKRLSIYGLFVAYRTIVLRCFE